MYRIFAARLRALLPTPSPHATGVLLALTAAVAFGALGVLATLAYQSGVNMVTLLSARFAIAGAVLWVVLARRGLALPRLRLLAAGLLLGLGGYSIQSALWFGSLAHINAALADLLMFAYPALVMLGTVVLGRERLSRRRMAALSVSTGGVVLVLAGGDAGALDQVGIALALASATAYAAYLLMADALLRRVDSLALAALVTTGAAISFTTAGLVHGGLQTHLEPRSIVLIVAIALVSTVFAIVSSLAGVRRIGAAKASILSTVEPPVSAGLAMLALGVHLTPLQLLGGGAVLSAVVILEARFKRLRREPRPALARAVAA